jgi:nucleoside-diphosphate-sugar epimerase
MKLLRFGPIKTMTTSKAKKVLGWGCKWQLERGIQKTVEWFLKGAK